jgi:hypothetical protein
MIWLAIIVIFIFLFYIGQAGSALKLIYHTFFVGLGCLFLYLGYDYHQASMSALPAAEYPNRLLVDYFSKEAYIRQANQRYFIGVLILIGTFVLPLIAGKQSDSQR